MKRLISLINLSRLISLTSMTLLVGCVSLSSPPKLQPFLTQAKVHQFIAQMAAQDNFDEQQLIKIMAQAQPLPQLINTINTPHEAKPWYSYQASFVNPKRASAGAKFWQQHAQSLAKAEREYGVPASIIVAILGVETYYGKNQGNYRVLDTLATLAFDYPPRAAFFQQELRAYLLLSRAQGFDPTSLRGSYAGAFGQAQFMPSSYLRYAVSSHGSKHADIIHDSDDAIFSIANYFKQKGWQKGEMIATPAKVNTNLTLISNQLKLSYTLKQLRQAGIQPTQTVPGNPPAIFINLAGQTGPEYWIGFHNFYVISRYNPRINYTMAVFQLSREIAAIYTHTGHTDHPG